MRRKVDARLPNQDPLHFFLQHSPDAVLVIEPCPDEAWVIVACNDVAAGLYCCHTDQLVGRPATLLDDLRAPEPIAAALAESLAYGARRYETIHRRHDGARIDVDLALTRIMDAGRDVILAVIRDLTAHHRSERRLTAQHAISRVLAEAGHFMDAVPPMLQLIGESLDWQMGAVWCVHYDSNTMRCTATWHAGGEEAPELAATNRLLAFPPGLGLPGEVWASGASRWLDDITAASNFPRRASAEAAGFRSAFAFPITGRDEVFGVIEFFSRESRPPDADVLGMAASIGSACGAFIDRYRAQQAMQASEARKGAILRSALDGIITIDHQGFITEFNPAAEAIFGFQADEVIGREMAEVIIPPALRAGHREGLARYLHSGEGPIIGRRIELPALRADGTEVPIELTVSRIPTAGPPMFTGFVRDIAEEKRAREQLRFLAEASTLLGSSLDYETTLASLARLAVPRFADWCSVNLLDAHGAFERVAGVHVDPEKEAMLSALREQQPPDLRRPTLADQTAPLDHPILIDDLTDAHLARVAQTEEQLRIYREMEFRSIMFVPMRTGEQLLGVIFLATGESGRRYDASDLALAEDLARRAALAIENARLYREARSAVQVRDEFLSIAAHELKTPVTAILGYTQVLQRRAAQAQMSTGRDTRALQVIVEQAERLTKLVASLLDVSRLERGQFMLDRQPIDLCVLGRRVAEEFQSTLPAEGSHTLTCSCSNDAIVVEGDAMRLEQVLLNLLQNAIKYSPAGGSIGLSITHEHGEAVIVVRDEGIGIPAPAQANLFQRFYRAPNVHGGNISGVGIGLYVVKEIVNRHGGIVAVESAEGRGSTFTVRLPIAVPASTA